jgi:hypothetical protein
MGIVPLDSLAYKDNFLRRRNVAISNNWGQIFNRYIYAPADA